MGREQEQGQNGEQQRKVLEVFGDQAAKERLPYDQPSYRREIRTRLLTFTCKECGQTVTQQKYPGPVPRYCSETCRDAAHGRADRERVRRYRERQRSASKVDDWG